MEVSSGPRVAPHTPEDGLEAGVNVSTHNRAGGRQEKVMSLDYHLNEFNANCDIHFMDYNLYITVFMVHSSFNLNAP